MLYPGKFSDRFLDGRFEVAILEIQSILPATYFRRRIRFLQHLCKTYKRHHRHVPSLDKNVQFPRNFDFSFEYFHSSSSDRDSTRRGIQDSHVPTTTIIYLNYEYSINAKCRFLINGIVHTNERDVNIVDNTYELDHDENKTWNFGIEASRIRWGGGTCSTDDLYATIFSLRGRNHFLSPLLFKASINVNK